MSDKQAAGRLFETIGKRLDRIRSLLDQMQESEAEPLIQMLLEAERVFVTGKGRSGFVANCFATRLMQMGLDVHVPGEATCPRIRRTDAMVAVSCSGSTATTVQLVRTSRSSGARVAAVTAAPESPLTAVADHLIIIPTIEGIPKSVYGAVLGPYNNTLFEETALLYLDAIILAILERRGLPEDVLKERHTQLE